MSERTDGGFTTRQVLALAQPSARRFVPGVLLGLLGGGSAVALLASSAWLITRAAEQPSIVYVQVAVVGVRAFAIFRGVFRYSDRLVSHDAALGQLGRLRGALLDRLIPSAPDGLTGIGRGDLLTRFARDVDQLQDLPLRVLQPAIVSVAVALGSVVAVGFISPVAAAWLGVCLIVAFVVGTLGHAAIGAAAERRVAPLRGELAGEVFDALGSIDELVAFEALAARLARSRSVAARLRAAERRSARGAGAAAAVFSLAAGAATATAIVVGVPELLAGGITGPELAVLALIPLAVFDVVGVVPGAVSSWRAVRSSAERVAAAVPSATPAGVVSDDETDAERAVDPPRARSITLSGLRARWPGGAAIGPIDLRLDAGDRVLITGESGSGKTTLAHALMRFLDYEGGYRVGEAEARVIGSRRVRRSVGLCEQSPWLFDSDIRQNLLFARDTASDVELMAVLDRVGLAGWAADRGGLSASVGERGALVSGGQAQRIALARALLADFPVLVVDEPTAGVDVERADALLRDLLAASGDRAVLLISHTPVADGLVGRRLRMVDGVLV